MTNGQPYPLVDPLAILARDGRPARETTGGFSLLEALIVVVILVVVFQAVTSSTVMISQSAEYGARKTATFAREQIALDRLLGELRMSSVAMDPFGGAPFARVEQTPDGPELHFRRVVNFGENGAEILPLWSTEIVYRVGGGLLLRAQDGEETVMLRDVESASFVIDNVGRFVVVLNVRLPGDTAAEIVQQSFVVKPMF